MATSHTELVGHLQQHRRRCQPSSGWSADSMKMCRQAMPSWESAVVSCGNMAQADPVIDRADARHADSQASPERQDPCKTVPPTPGFKHAVETEEDCNKLGHYWISEVEPALWRGEAQSVPVQRGMRCAPAARGLQGGAGAIQPS